MNVRISIGYKFIIGFIIVVAGTAFIPKAYGFIDFGNSEWLREPVSFLTAIVIGLIMGYYISMSLTKNFSRLTEIARKISHGDLTDMGERTKKFTIDETTDLEISLILMVKNLRGLVGHMKDAASNMTEYNTTLTTLVNKGHETSGEVTSGTSRIFDGALTQSNHVDETSKMVIEMAELSDEVATKVTDTANASQRVNSMVQRGANTATSAIEKLETIFKGIEKTETAAAGLKEKLSDIPKILDVITHISRQTDLLALNATIEASKAGEHGRGFALVADEVRRFADNTNKSVEDVERVVKELRHEVESVFGSASEGAASLKDGRNDIRKVREILGDILEYTSEVAEKAATIISLTQRQKSMAESSVDTIEKVAQIARENVSSTETVENAVERHSATIEETLQASEKITELSEELNGVISKFRVEETTVASKPVNLAFDEDAETIETIKEDNEVLV